MTTKGYLLISITTFILIVSGSDLFARVTIGGDTIGQAFVEHLRWVSLTIVGVILLFFPFGVVAFACGRANKRSRTRFPMAIFCVAVAILAYFYFSGFQAAEHAMLERKWTAASLSIGLLPFFIGVPLWASAEILTFLVARFDRRPA